MLQPYDREKLRVEFADAKPVPHVKIDNFIDAEKAKAIAAATTSLRQVPVSFARESRDEQHMNAISKKERRPGVKSKIPQSR